MRTFESLLCDDLTRVDFNPYVLGRDANVYEKGRDRGQELRLGGDRFDTNNVHIPLVSVKRDLVSVKRDLTSQGKQTHLVRTSMIVALISNWSHVIKPRK